MSKIFKRIYIVSGTYDEFLDYRNRKILECTEPSVPEYVYVSDVTRIYGLDEIEGYYIGSYEQRKDINDIRWRITKIKSRNKLNSFDYLVQVNGVSLRKDDYYVEKVPGSPGSDQFLFHLKEPPAMMDAIQFTDINGANHYSIGNGSMNHFFVRF